MLHLAIETLIGRWGRTLLLIVAVALATVLTVGVSASIGTMRRALQEGMGQIAGLADVAIAPRFGGQVPTSMLDTARAWEGVDVATGHFQKGVTLRLERTEITKGITVQGIDPEAEMRIKPIVMSAGRMIEAPGETVLDRNIAERFEAEVGDTLQVVRFGEPASLKVVGIFHREHLDILQNPLALVTLADAYELTGYEDVLDNIEIKLAPGSDVDAFIAAHRDEVAQEYRFEPAAPSRAGVTRAMYVTNLVLILIIQIASFSAGFNIVTCLTSSVTQRLRELAILRCIGTARWQLAASQVVAGLFIAIAGALVGGPIGFAGAYWLYWRHSDKIASGFHPEPIAVAAAVGAAVLAGLLGAIYPAIAAASVRPLEAMTFRARKPRLRNHIICGLVGLALASAWPIATRWATDPDAFVWYYVYFGVGMTFVGYFLISVPVLAVVSRVLTPVVAWVLRIPRDLLNQSIRATPFRHGFTGGSLMVGLALLVGIWTVGRSFMAGWFDNLRMPDAFVHDNNRLISPEQVAALGEIDGIEHICPVVLFPVEAKEARFGLKDIHPPLTLYVSSDVESFFNMTDLDWVQGDDATARKRLAEGRAVVVSAEYLQAHGLGLGGTITLSTVEGPVPFDIVGVIRSRGLDVGVAFFGLRDKYADAALSCVFGTREDSARYFRNDNTRMVLVGFAPGADEGAVREAFKKRLPELRMHTSTIIRRIAHHIMNDLMGLASTIAFWSMVISCFGVGNLVIAEIAARRHEFGVLRAIGGSASLLARLVAGQTIIIAIVGCVAGAALGTQLAKMDQWFHLRLGGIVWQVLIPWDVIAWGSLAVVGSALVAAAPALWRLVRVQPRTLLAAAT